MTHEINDFDFDFLPEENTQNAQIEFTHIEDISEEIAPTENTPSIVHTIRNDTEVYTVEFEPFNVYNNNYPANVTYSDFLPVQPFSIDDFDRSMNTDNNDTDDTDDNAPKNSKKKKKTLNIFKPFKKVHIDNAPDETEPVIDNNNDSPEYPDYVKFYTVGNDTFCSIDTTQNNLAQLNNLTNFNVIYDTGVPFNLETGTILYPFDKNDYYTRTQLAEILHVTPHTIKNWEDKNKIIPTVIVSERKVYYSKDYTNKLIKQGFQKLNKNAKSTLKSTNSTPKSTKSSEKVLYKNTPTGGNNNVNVLQTAADNCSDDYYSRELLLSTSKVTQSNTSELNLDPTKAHNKIQFVKIPNVFLDSDILTFNDYLPLMLAHSFFNTSATNYFTYNEDKCEHWYNPNVTDLRKGLVMLINGIVRGKSIVSRSFLTMPESKEKAEYEQFSAPIQIKSEHVDYLKSIDILKNKKLQILNGYRFNIIPMKYWEACRPHNSSIKTTSKFKSLEEEGIEKKITYGYVEFTWEEYCALYNKYKIYERKNISINSNYANDSFRFNELINVYLHIKQFLNYNHHAIVENQKKKNRGQHIDHNNAKYYMFLNELKNYFPNKYSKKMTDYLICIEQAGLIVIRPYYAKDNKKSSTIVWLAKWQNGDVVDINKDKRYAAQVKKHQERIENSSRYVKNEKLMKIGKPRKFKNNDNNSAKSVEEKFIEIDGVKYVDDF